MKGMQAGLPKMLRLLRAERGLTLEEAAKRTGVTRETLGLLERGKRHPHTPTLAKIANGYGVSLEDLLDLEEGRGAHGKSTSPATLEDLEERGAFHLYEEQRGASRAFRLSKEQQRQMDEHGSVRLTEEQLRRLGIDAGVGIHAEEEGESFKMPVERTSPEPSTKEERLENLRDTTRECLDMASEAFREFEALKQSGTKRQLEILGGRALCTYLGAAYLTHLALNAGHRQGMPVDDEERQAREDAVHAVNKLGDAASEIMEASRASGMVIGMREYQLRRATGS